MDQFVGKKKLPPDQESDFREYCDKYVIDLDSEKDLEEAFERFSAGETHTPELKDIQAWNLEQLKHVELVQRLLLFLTHLITERSLAHDRSKFTDEEYVTFLCSHEILNQARSGDDESYKRCFKTVAIQHHVKNNQHHPEYWDARAEPMPFLEIIIMYFDWLSRTIQKGSDYREFRDYNFKKLENQPHAKVIVESLEKQFPAEMFQEDWFYNGLKEEE